MVFFSFFWREETTPTRETVRAKEKMHKMIREGNIPPLQPFTVLEEIPVIVSYKKGTAEISKRKKRRNKKRKGKKVVISDEILTF